MRVTTALLLLCVLLQLSIIACDECAHGYNWVATENDCSVVLSADSSNVFNPRYTTEDGNTVVQLQWTDFYPENGGTTIFFNTWMCDDVFRSPFTATTTFKGQTIDFGWGSTVRGVFFVIQIESNYVKVNNGTGDYEYIGYFPTESNTYYTLVLNASLNGFNEISVYSEHGQNDTFLYSYDFATTLGSGDVGLYSGFQIATDGSDYGNVFVKNATLYSPTGASITPSPCTSAPATPAPSPETPAPATPAPVQPTEPSGPLPPPPTLVPEASFTISILISPAPQNPEAKFCQAQNVKLYVVAYAILDHVDVNCTSNGRDTAYYITGNADASTTDAQISQAILDNLSFLASPLNETYTYTMTVQAGVTPLSAYSAPTPAPSPPANLLYKTSNAPTIGYFSVIFNIVIFVFCLLI